jgi:cysteinyl-tRNA synthetase
VSNFTDVDDKIIKKAAEEGTTESVIAERYIEAYQQVRTQLNTELPDITPRVTETMDEIIAFVDELVKSGHAYVVDGDVYFSVDSVPTYGEISHQKLDQLEAGARIETNDQKKNPYDFALWKKTDLGIKWNSPWGMGRPGWHTECVVMINDNLGEKIDIHGGGMDLKFPHHENEAAQQEACHGNALANYWIHNAMVNINGEKMSKSLGNTMWAKDVVDALGTNLTRWLVSSVHYRKELNFSDETIETARKELDKVLTPLKQADIKAALANADMGEAYDEAEYRAFLDAMDDDMNTPNAYAVIFETVKKLNQTLRQREINFEAAGTYRNAVEKMLNILGIVVEKPVITDEDRELFAKWNEAKKAKDFASADVYRAQLSEKGLL